MQIIADNCGIHAAQRLGGVGWDAELKTLFHYDKKNERSGKQAHLAGSGGRSVPMLPGL